MDITVAEIHTWLEERAGHPLHDDEGVMFGELDRRITGVTVCWMPSPENIRSTAVAHHELIIHHESLLYPYPFDHSQPLAAMRWPTNSHRLQALGEGNLVATRLHGTLDELYIQDEFSNRLGLRKIIAQGKDYWHRVYEIKPTTYASLIDHVKEAVGLDTVRATNIKPDRVVRKVGMPWGGLGLFVNVDYVQALLDLIPDIDVMIVGETDNYGFRFCTELGIDVIETSHEVSENAGLGKFAHALSQQFKQIDVKHIADPCVWMSR